jgi:ABC-type antimicrobial peptide transport system permease subunit
VSAEAVPAATEALSALIRARHHIRAGQDDDFNIRHPEEVLQAKIETSKTYSVLMLTLGLLVLMVSGIGIMNVMLASVSQRTREIGVRIAVGATPGQVQAQFLGEALMLALVGGTLGVGLSLVGAVVIEHRLGWPLVMSVETTALALLFSAVVGVLFGFYPSIRASRLDPIEALRNE